MADLIYKTMVLWMILLVGAWQSDPAPRHEALFQLALLAAMGVGAVAAGFTRTAK